MSASTVKHPAHKQYGGGGTLPAAEKREKRTKPQNGLYVLTKSSVFSPVSAAKTVCVGHQKVA